MSQSDRAVYGRALGTTLVGLAGLASQGVLTSDANAESAPTRVLTSQSKHKEWFDLNLAFPNNPNGVEICPTGDLDGDGMPDILVGSPDGEPDGFVPLITATKGNHIPKAILSVRREGISLGNYIKIDPPDLVGIASGAASGPNTHIKLHSWDRRSPSSPPTLLDDQDAFPGQTMRSGVHVATGDLDGDGRAEVAVGSSGDIGQPGALPASSYIKIGTVEGEGPNDAHIKMRPEFYPYGQDYRGGIRVATGDVDGDGRADLVTVGQQNGKTKIDSFTWKISAFETFGSLVLDTPNGGDVTVAVGDVTGDGVPDLCVSKHKERKDVIDIFTWSTGSAVTAGGGPEGGLVWTLYDSISVYGGSSYDGGFNMVIQDVTGDGIGDIIAAPAGVVPEPSSLALLSATALGLRRRRRRPPQ